MILSLFVVSTANAKEEITATAVVIVQNNFIDTSDNNKDGEPDLPKNTAYDYNEVTNEIAF